MELTARCPDNVDAARDSLKRSPKKSLQRRSEKLVGIGLHVNANKTGYISILNGSSLKLVSFGLVSFVFNGISTLFRLFNAKAILLEEQ